MTCPREGRLIGGCKFEARYEEVPLSAEERTYASSVSRYQGTLISVLNKLQRERYIRDVCTRCGKTIERNGDATS